MKRSEIMAYLAYDLCVLSSSAFKDGEPYKTRLTLLNYETQINTLKSKPIFHRLCDITKPCLPGGLIPIVELAKMAKFNIGFKGEWKTNGFMPIAKNGDLTFLICQTLFYGTIEGDKKTHNNQVYNQLELLQKLFEWHFDVYDLISKGEAIDINILKEAL